ncbi:hypothetical protein [Desulfitobacterium chlororespirans]|uniref:hypothetical protein n=1 Tax=Desulfitobacterium chlororespirans TaxID=51616 RepID=UPI0009328653|nr:hypothetical protein [Desulfitobacterium chlororespirans]
MISQKIALVKRSPAGKSGREIFWRFFPGSRLWVQVVPAAPATPAKDLSRQPTILLKQRR